MALYRKYRPQTFQEMVGQNHIKLTLQNELEQGNFVHAYLFCGPRGLGKTTAARLFAKALNCEKRQAGASEPCNQCASCTEIMKAQALDVIEIDAASHTGVDNVRENIIENARFSPSKSKYKIFIIDEVHMLSLSAFNALLKTLEEPPRQTVFILCTTELHKVPETIISRCQRFDFKKVPVAEAVKRLKKIAEAEGLQLDDDIFEIIAGKSEGCMRDAESLLGQVFSIGGKRITREQAELVLPTTDLAALMDFIYLLVQNNMTAALDFLNTCMEEGVNLEILNKELVEFLRKLILLKSGVMTIDLLGARGEQRKKAEHLLEVTEIGKLTSMISIFLNTIKELKNSPIEQLPLELAVIKICEPTDVYKTASMPKAPVFRNPALDKPQATEMKNSAEAVKHRSDDNILEKIKTSWTEIIQTGHGRSRDLAFINEKMVWPVEIKEEKLVIGFKYDLHQARFASNSNQDIFRQVLKDVLGSDLKVESKTLKASELADLEIQKAEKENKDDKLSGMKVTEENILDEVLNSFGGEVVE